LQDASGKLIDFVETPFRFSVDRLDVIKNINFDDSVNEYEIILIDNEENKVSS
jgi:hypothetical protein